MKKFVILTTLLCLTGATSFSQTIAEKLASGSSRSPDGGGFDLMLREVNQELTTLRSDLSVCYKKANGLLAQEAKEESFQELLKEASDIRQKIQSLETAWHDSAVGESKRDEEGYALWDQEETTLAQLVMEYGALDYLFIVPTEMAALKLNMHSNIPIPRESWGEMLEIILSHNGVGIKKINNYVRQLYILKQDPSAIQAIASSSVSCSGSPTAPACFMSLPLPSSRSRAPFSFSSGSRMPNRPSFTR